MANLNMINPLRSIGTRIFVGFLLVLLMLSVIVAMVWRAAERVDDALNVDAISQTADAHISGVQIALLEARLRMAAYLHTANLVERGELAAAIDRLQALAATPHDAQGSDIAEVGTMIAPVRVALSNAAEAIADLRSETAAVVAATAVLSNRGTALAESAARLGNAELAEAAAAVLADIVQTSTAASRVSVTYATIDFDTAFGASTHGKQILAAMDEAHAGSARVQRLAIAARDAFDSLQSALTRVRLALTVRSKCIAELAAAESRAIAISDQGIRSIASARLDRRADVAAAQHSLRATSLKVAIGAGALGTAVSLWLGLSITRPISRLARTMRGLADGSLDVVVPDASARDEVGALAGAVVAIQGRSAYLATHDALTDLPNRTLFHDNLDRALAWSRRENVALAVLYIDLDNFKDVNDTLGHAVGDQLLVQVASRLSAHIRRSDTLARLGGDEFAIVHVGVHGAADSGLLAERLLETLTEPFEIEGHSIAVGASIGLAVRSGTDLQLLPLDSQILLQEADVALYQAKEQGRGKYCFYEADMNARIQERRALEDDIREALKNGQFELYYQPQFNVADRRIVGAEALIRWRHPRRGNVSPAMFIPIAEQTGQILQIGEWTSYQWSRENLAGR